jgi:precorrin-6B C5,15-methyltransferase / cobalt-precorrin-6B C5,C15-methyltransferase
MIDVIGIGLDGRSGLTEATKQIIARATIISGASRHLSYFSEHPALKITLNNLERDLDLVINKATKTEKVVILASGDPLFFWLGKIITLKNISR